MTTVKTDRRTRIDWDLLRSAYRSTRTQRLLPLRAISAQTGIPISGLSRFARGGKLSADGLARVLAWLHPGSVPWWIADGTPSIEDEEEL